MKKLLELCCFIVSENILSIVRLKKVRGQIMEAVDMRPEVVNLLIGEDVRVIPAEEANVGDILLVRAGDRIPLDGVVIEGESLLDTSPVTGEPVPVKRSFGDEVISGCINTSGMLKIRVEKVMAESMVTKILDSVENAAASKPQLDRFITRFALYLYSVCCGSSCFNCCDTRLYNRKLGILDLYSLNISGYQLPMCTGAERAFGVFFRHWSRLEIWNSF